jgi:hypothetical protein
MKIVEACKDELITLRFEDYRILTNCISVPIVIEVRNRKGDLEFVRVNKQLMLDYLKERHQFLTKDKLVEQLKELQKENHAVCN